MFKKILVALLAVFVVSAAEAQTPAPLTRSQYETSLMGFGMPGPLAELISQMSTGLAVESNNQWLMWRNAAGTANINVLKVDGSDDTWLNADSGDVINLSVAGTPEVVFNGTNQRFTDNTGILVAPTAVAVHIGATPVAELTFSDDTIAFTGNTGIIVAPTAVSIQAGATPVAIWAFNASGQLVQNASTGSGLVMSRAGTGANRGVSLGAAAIPADVGTSTTLFSLSDVSTAAQAILEQATADTSGVNLDLYKTRATDGSGDTIVVNGDTVGNINFRGANGTNFSLGARIQAKVSAVPGAADMPMSLDFQTSPDGSASPASVLLLDQDKSALFSGTVRSSATGSLGWSYVTGANTACTTTCTSAAVFGVDLAAGASQPVIVDASSATADACVCAGAS